MKMRFILYTLVFCLISTPQPIQAIIKKPLIDGHVGVTLNATGGMVQFTLSDDIIAMFKALDIDLDQVCTAVIKRMHYEYLLITKRTEHGVFSKDNGLSLEELYTGSTTRSSVKGYRYSIIIQAVGRSVEYGSLDVARWCKEWQEALTRHMYESFLECIKQHDPAQYYIIEKQLHLESEQ
jgi:hypothetical protein